MPGAVVDGTSEGLALVDGAEGEGDAEGDGSRACSTSVLEHPASRTPVAQAAIRAV